jgi:hypothetical protein
MSATVIDLADERRKRARRKSAEQMTVMWNFQLQWWASFWGVALSLACAVGPQGGWMQ